MSGEKEFFLLEDKLISKELFDEMFFCDYEACKGACCVEGDEGAPLQSKEIIQLEDDLEKILPELDDSGRKVIQKLGVFIKKKGGDYKTPLVNNRACAFTVFENGKALCGIEKAWKEGKTSLQKPVSCHLYPIRIRSENGMDILEYDRWDICSPACKLGKSLGKPVFRFVKDALIRNYGEQFYLELENLYSSYKS
ncbi:MAG: DUF3109 family protein [Chitinophagaceae bacterium]|nr:MAG: DUF3109 family protein [Chitinophagaceae bacterium]